MLKLMLWNTRRNKSLEQIPYIDFNPKELSYTESEWKSEWRLATISLYNPIYCHINDAHIIITNLKDWDIGPSVAYSLKDFIPRENAFVIQDFGNYQNNITTERIQIKAGPNITPGVYFLNITFVCSYMGVYSTSRHNFPRLNNTTKAITLKVLKDTTPSDTPGTIGILFLTFISVVLLLRDWLKKLE